MATSNATSSWLPETNWLYLWVCPPATIVTDNVSTANPSYISWLVADQLTLILLQSSLSEEAMDETFFHDIGHNV